MFDILGDLLAELFGGIVEDVRGRKVHRLARFENRSARRLYLAGYGRRNFARGHRTPVISHQSGSVIIAALAERQLAEDFGGEWKFVELEPNNGQQYLKYVDTDAIQDAETYELHKSLELDGPPPQR